MIETERLIIRHYTVRDYYELFAILSNAKTMSFWPRPLTFDETKAWVDRSIQS